MAKVINAVRRINSVLLKLEEVFMVFSLFGLLFAIFIQVICRYLLKAPTPWAEELGRYLFVCMSYIGSAYALSHLSHIEINLIDQVLPKITGGSKVAERIIEVAGILITVVFLVAFSIIYFSFLSKIAHLGQRSASMQIRMVFPMGSILIGSILMIFHGLYLLIPQEKITGVSNDTI